MCGLLTYTALIILAVSTKTSCQTLIDPVIVSDGSVARFLDGDDWTVSSPGFNDIRGTVPGDLVTDLQVAGLARDPLYELNWIEDAHLWANNAWTYKKSFTVSAADIASLATGGDFLIVFDGAKMSSNVNVNGVSVGDTTNQYLRYTFSIKDSVKVGDNLLSVTFDPLVQTTEGRWAACTGGWDWAAVRGRERRRKNIIKLAVETTILVARDKVDQDGACWLFFYPPSSLPLPPPFPPSIAIISLKDRAQAAPLLHVPFPLASGAPFTCYQFLPLPSLHLSH
jgi:hypothetical protein